MIAGTLEIQMVAGLARLQNDMNQAKGMVGGAMKGIEASVAAAKSALGALGVGISFGTLIAGIRSIGKEMIAAGNEAEMASNRLNATLRATGGAAGLTRLELDKMADSLAKSTTFDDEAIRNAASELLIFRNIQGNTFRETLKLATDVAAKLGTDLPSAAAKLGRAMEDPETTFGLLRRQGILLTEQQKDQIKAMGEAGDKAGQQQVLLDRLKQAYAGTAVEMNQGINKATHDLSKAWGELMEEFGRTGPLKVVVEGSFLSIAAALEAVRKKSEESSESFKRNALLQHGSIQFTPPTGVPQTPGVVLDPKSIAGQLAGLPSPGFLSREEMLARGKAQAAAAAQREAQSAEAAYVSAREAAKLAAKAAEAAAKERLAMLERYRNLDAAGWVKYIEETTAEYERGLAEEAKLTEDFYAQKEKLDAAGLAAWMAMIDAEQDHAIAVGAAMTQDITENHKALQDASDALKKRREQDAAEMRRQADEIGRGLSDALMRGFEGGKDAATNFIDTLKNMFKTLVLRPVLQFVLSPVTGALTSGLAGMLPGAANASVGGTNPLSLLSSGTSLLQMLGGSIGGSFGAGLTYAGSSGVGIAGGLMEALTGGGSFGFGAGAALPGIGLALGALSLGKMLFGKEKTPAVGVGYRYQGEFDPTQGTSNLAMLALNNKNELEAVAGSKVQRRVDMFDDAIKPVFEEFQKLAGILKLDSSSIGKTAFDFTTAGIGNEHDAASRPAVAAQLLEKWASQLPGLKEQAKENESLTETLMRLSNQRLAENVEAEAIAATERERAVGIARQQRDLNIQIVELEGRAADALFHRRVDELEALDPTLHATQKLVWAMQDQATAAEEAARTAEAAARAETERMAAIQNAEGVLRSAYERQASDFTQAIAKWADAAKTLRDYGDSLTGAGAGGMSYSAAAARFAIVAAQARAGSSDAMGNLPGVSEAFRLASERNAATSVDYRRDLAGIVNTVFGVADVADRQGSIVQQQLDASRSAVSELISLNEEVVSVKKAISELKATMTQVEIQARKTANITEAVTRGDLSFSTAE